MVYFVRMPDKEFNKIEETAVGTPEGALSQVEQTESTRSQTSEAPARPEQISAQASIPQTVSDVTTSAVAQPTKKDELTQEVEEVLSDDLDELYKQLPSDRQRAFKAEGEKTAGLIAQMLAQGKVHVRRIVGLIRDWLKLIPGVNRFFLEQESKIKTDRIIQIAEEETQKQKRL